MRSEVSVYLLITGLDLDPEKVTQYLGIEPTTIWHKGDLIDPRAKLRRKKNGWRLSSPLENSNSLEDLTRSLLEKLEISWTNLIEVCSQHYTELSCVIYVSDQVPAIHFEADILEKIHQLNASIDVDLYVLPEPEESDLEMEESASELVANPVPIEPPKQEVTK